MNSNDAAYLMNNVFRGLYSYNNDEGLVEEGAKSCKPTKLKLECELADRAWSDGSKIVADDYVRAFRRLVGSSGKNVAIELLKNLKNTKKVHGGKLPADQLGIRAPDAKHLVFEFENPDPEFAYKLTSSALVPVKSDVFPSREKSNEAIVNGPYRVVAWTPGRRVRLEPNLQYPNKMQRPPVEVLFVDDDETAYNLYEQGELTFLRRLPTTLIPTARKRADFIQIPIARFDYLGFSPALDANLREALAYSLDFNELARIYDALGTPGCPSLPRDFMDDEPCIKIDLAKAKEAWAKVPSSLQKKRYSLAFSKLGGDDVKKGAEWEQAQWKKNLGLETEIQSFEQGVYLAALRSGKTPDIFRKGIGLERPTCLAALETFAKGGSENFVGYQSDAYEKIVAQLTAAMNKHQKRRLCSLGVKLLEASNRILPLGRIHFTLLARPEFKGWNLNEMNQLDLTRLHVQ